MLLLLPLQLAAGVRIATWNLDLSRDGPGLLLDALRSDKDAEVSVLVQGVQQVRPDVLLLTRVDHDPQGIILTAIRNRLSRAGLEYPYSYAPLQNRGVPTGVDLDGDGRLGGYEDAQGYGRFSGDGAMALLSRWPITQVADYAGFLWRDLPDARIASLSAKAQEVQRLSSSGHWVVEVAPPDGPAFKLLAWAGAAPNFGQTSRNPDRNHDEAAFWPALLKGRLPMPPPDGPFILAGLGNDLSPLAAKALQNAPALGEAYAPLTVQFKQGPKALSWLQAGQGQKLVAKGYFPDGDIPFGMDRLIWIDAEILLPP